jgi:polysaccharide biosynthesis protein VpsQ
MVHHKQQFLHLEIARPGSYCPYAEVVAAQRPLAWYLYRLSQVAALGFFFFVLWLIYLANTGQSSIFFKIGSSLSFRDKLGHCVLYALLTFKVNAAFCYKQVSLGKRFSLYLGTLLVFCFSFMEEMTQYFIPTRTVECWDLIANTLGITLSTCLSWWIDKTWVHKKKFKGSAA